MKTDWIGQIGIQLILEDPFWGRLYRSLSRKVDERVIEVGLVFEEEPGFSIAFHPLAAGKIFEPDFLSRTKHELLHFLLGHPLQRNQVEHKDYFDLAADLCVDQLVRPYPGSLSIQDFPGFALLPFRLAEVYYQGFLSILEEGIPQRVSFLEKYLLSRQALHQKHQWWDQAGATLFAFDQLLTELEKEQPLHSEVPWPDKLWPLFQESRKRSVAYRINWKDQLHWLVRTSRHTHLVYKKNRRSRRYGVPPGIKVKRKHRLLIAVDTSGSVRTEELQLFFQEIQRLYRQGVDMEIVECDSQIQKRYPYSGKLPEMVTGRGDTSYQAPIELFNEEKDFGGLLYFTDGDGPPPFIQPKRPVLWVMSRGIKKGDRRKYDHFPGKKVVM